MIFSNILENYISKEPAPRTPPRKEARVEDFVHDNVIHSAHCGKFPRRNEGVYRRFFWILATK